MHPLISLAFITSGVKEVTWTYCTGCRKWSVGLHIRLRPTGPFQSNNTLYQNCIPKVIYTTTYLTGKQYVLCQIQSRGAEECVFRSGIRHLRALLVSASFCDYYCKPKEIEMHKLIWLFPITIVSIIIILINVLLQSLFILLSLPSIKTTGIVLVLQPIYQYENH